MRNILFITALALAFATGCAKDPHYSKAFQQETRIQGSMQTVSATAENTLAACTEAFVKTGFLVEEASETKKTIRAKRQMPDPENPEITYVIIATATAVPKNNETSLCLVANQQTLVREVDTRWWKLLWIIPLFPVETVYETHIAAEGEIIDATFYESFFKTVSELMPDYS